MKQDMKNKLIEKMPPTFLDIVCHGTTIIINDYIIKKDYDTPDLKLVNFLSEDEKNYGLLTLEHIARLEKKYRLDNVTKITEIQKEILNIQDDLSNIDITTLQQSIQLKNYLISKILPSFGISDNALVSQVDTIINNRKKIANDPIIESKPNSKEEISYSSNFKENGLFAKYLEMKKAPQTESEKKNAKDSQIETANPTPIVSKSIDAESLFTKNLLNEQNIFLHYEKVYSLRNTPFFEALFIKYNNKTLFPFPGIDLEIDGKIFNIALLRKAYKGVLIDQLEQEAFDNNPYKQKLTTINQKLDNIINGEFLKNEGIGIDFFSNSNPNKCYLTKKINAFVLKDPKNGGTLHYFAPTKIGVEITYNKDNSVSHGSVMVMDRYMPFPFLNSNSPKTAICTGNGKDIFTDYSLSNDMQIIQKINIGEHTMYRGYNGQFTPYSRLDESQYQNSNDTHKLITKKEMEKLGLTPSNI